MSNPYNNLRISFRLGNWWNMALIAFSGPKFHGFSYSSDLSRAVFWWLGLGINSIINVGWPENHLVPSDSTECDLLGLGAMKLLKQLKMSPFFFLLKSLKSCQLDKFWRYDLQRYSKFAYRHYLWHGICLENKNINILWLLASGVNLGGKLRNSVLPSFWGPTVAKFSIFSPQMEFLALKWQIAN